MTHKHMRIPWLATLDALTEELNRHLDNPVADVGKTASSPPQGEGRGVLEILGNRPSDVTLQDRIQSAIKHLLEARRDLEDVPHSAMLSVENVRDIGNFFSDLQNLEQRLVRYPDMDGKEGLARFIERGGLIGPVLGAHIAAVIRGQANLKPGVQLTFDEGRKRRFAVKQIATIQHLYEVGLRKAVAMFCDAAGFDDPDATAFGRHEQWVKRDRRHASRLLENGNLPVRDELHYKAILNGLHPDISRGLLKGQPYPEALNELRMSLNQ